jgi:hypothetical protein
MSKSVFIAVAASLWMPAIIHAAELRPIVEVESGYFFGASADGKWIKAEQAAKSVSDGTS